MSTSFAIGQESGAIWGVVAQTNITITPQWQRFEVTGQTLNGLQELYMDIGTGGFTSGASVEMWGAQFVAGSSAGQYSSTAGGTTTVLATGLPGTLVPTGLNEAYAYDSFGNILQNGGFNSTYTANNQMSGYAYDAAGNLLSNGVTPLTWDAESRLTSAAGATYLYDAEGNRVEKQGVGVTDTIYFGGRPIARLNGGQWTDLIYGPTGLLAEVPGTQTGDTVYRVTDHLGTTVGDLPPDGRLVNPLDYRPFGGVFSGNTNDPYLFTGLERDQESGLDHTMFRQYASNSGRWLSPDPYDGSMDFGNPQSLNRYAYVGNSPLSYVDPSGLDGDRPSHDQNDICFSCIYNTIASFFTHPTFNGTTTSRPIWDEHGSFQVHPLSAADVLGLPSGGCEFGACGDSFGPGSHRRGNCQFIFGNCGFSGQDVFAWLGLYELANNTVQVGKFHANAHQMTYENWCGPGGSGPDLSGHDSGCHVHDVCYDTHGLKVLDNFNRGFPGTSALHGCNQQLCNALPGTLVDKYFSGLGSPFGGRCSK